MGGGGKGGGLLEEGKGGDSAAKHGFSPSTENTQKKTRREIQTFLEAASVVVMVMEICPSSC